MQETFLRAWAACRSFDPSAGPSLATWLGTIGRNVAVDMLRARSVRPRLAAEADDRDERAGTTEDVDAALAADGADRRAVSGQPRAPGCCAARRGAGPSVRRRRRRTRHPGGHGEEPRAPRPARHAPQPGPPQSRSLERPTRISTATIEPRWRPDRVFLRRSAHARAPGGEMKKYAPLATLVAVVLLGAGLLVANMLSNPANQTTAATTAAPSAVAAAPSEPAAAAPESAAPAAPAVAEKAYTGRSVGQRGDRRDRGQERQGRGLRLRRQEDRGVAGGHAGRRHAVAVGQDEQPHRHPRRQGHVRHDHGRRQGVAVLGQGRQRRPPGCTRAAGPARASPRGSGWIVDDNGNVTGVRGRRTARGSPRRRSEPGRPRVARDRRAPSPSPRSTATRR